MLQNLAKHHLTQVLTLISKAFACLQVFARSSKFSLFDPAKEMVSPLQLQCLKFTCRVGMSTSRIPRQTVSTRLSSIRGLAWIIQADIYQAGQD